MSINASVQQLAIALSSMVAGWIVSEGPNPARVKLIAQVVASHGVASAGPATASWVQPTVSAGIAVIDAHVPETSGPLVGYALAGLVAAGATVISIMLSSGLRLPDEEIAEASAAVDSLAEQSDSGDAAGESAVTSDPVAHF